MSNWAIIGLVALGMIIVYLIVWAGAKLIAFCERKNNKDDEEEK